MSKAGYPGFAEKVRFGAGLPRYLAQPLTLEEARRELGDRLDARSANFLELMRTGVFANPHSPYHRLLRHAGCSYSDLESQVRRLGLESTLLTLRDAGVRVSLDELRGRCPIERDGLRFVVRPEEFDHRTDGHAWTASTSGTSGSRGRVPYRWDFISDEAANEMLLFESFGILDAPGAFWMPTPPGISGIHNLLIQLRFRRPPRAWFSHLRLAAPDRIALAGLSLCTFPLGAPAPFPREAPLGRAHEITEWLARGRKAGQRRYLKAFTSSAVRVAHAAREREVSLEGTVFLCGGEATTAARRRYMESAGARVVPRYAATEIGLIAGGCGDPTIQSSSHEDHSLGIGHQPQRAATEHTDIMHLYTDRLALVYGEATDPRGSESIRPLLFTSLLPSAGKILLNADLGDTGILSSIACDCVLGKAGLLSGISNVQSRLRHTSEGMSLLIAELESIVNNLVLRAGGSPSDCLIHERISHDVAPSESAASFSQITITIDPRVRLAGDDRFLVEVYNELRVRGEGWKIVAETWSQAGTIRLVRGAPVSPGFKQVPARSVVEGR